MPELKVHSEAKTPTEMITQAVEVATLSAGGKQISVKKPGVLSQYRIVEAVGNSAKNEVYMAMILPLLWVTAIDGNEVPPITTKVELEALIQRLGEDGIEAVMKHVNGPQADGAPNAESVKN